MSFTVYGFVTNSAAIAMHRPHYLIRLSLSSYIVSAKIGKMVQRALWIAVVAAYYIGAQNVLGTTRTVPVTCICA